MPCRCRQGSSPISRSKVSSPPSRLAERGRGADDVAPRELRELREPREIIRGARSRLVMALRDHPVKMEAMQLALTAPVYKSIALAALALGVGAAASSLYSSSEPVTHRMRLHAVDEPNAIYLSVFRNGDIRVRFDGGELHPLTFKVRATISDGCRWLGIETLVPRDERSFDYDYSERILACEPGATPARKTPRKGVVTIED